MMSLFKQAQFFCLDIAEIFCTLMILKFHVSSFLSSIFLKLIFFSLSIPILLIVTLRLIIILWLSLVRKYLCREIVIELGFIGICLVHKEDMVIMLRLKVKNKYAVLFWDPMRIIVKGLLSIQLNVSSLGWLFKSFCRRCEERLGHSLLQGRLRWRHTSCLSCRLQPSRIRPPRPQLMIWIHGSGWQSGGRKHRHLRRWGWWIRIPWRHRKTLPCRLISSQDRI